MTLNILRSAIALMTAGLLIMSCSEEDANTPTVQLHSISQLTHSSATLQGEVISSGSSDVLQKGFVWDTDPSPTIDLSMKAFQGGSSIGLYSIQLTELTPDTKYYFRPFASNGAGVAYGDEHTFTTLPENAPTVRTLTVTDIKFASAVVGGEVTNEGSSPVTESGIVYGTMLSPTVEDNKVVNTNGTDTFSMTLTGLTNNTIYYHRAYAKNDIGVSYGITVSFRTQAHVLATVQTLTASDVTVSSVKISGNVTNAGTTPVTERGIVYSTTPLPTVASIKSVHGAGTGNFVAQITGLSENTVYYARAYATSDAGNSYGAEKIFRTCVSALPLSYLNDWFSLSGVHTYMIYDDEIISHVAGISYLYGSTSSITQVNGGYDVVGYRMGWTNPVTFYFRQSADTQSLSIGSSNGSTITHYRVVARRIRRVTFGAGNASFSQVNEGTSWIEKDNSGVQTSWTFTETSRTDWQVNLSRNDGAKIRLDLNTKAIYFSATPAGALTKLYDITAAFDW
jgi:hypothetical protein